MPENKLDQVQTPVDLAFDMFMAQQERIPAQLRGPEPPRRRMPPDLMGLIETPGLGLFPPPDLGREV